MIKQVAVLILAGALAFGTPPALANDELSSDLADADAATKALQSGRFSDAVEKADQIIKRFEKTKAADSVYDCTRSDSDTFVTLIGPAAARKKGSDAGAVKTVAFISDDICLAYFAKGFALVHLNRRDEALPNLEMAAAMGSGNAHYLNELAEWHKNSRDWSKSLEFFTRASKTIDMAVALADDNAVARRALYALPCRVYRGIGFNLAELKRWDEARAALRECLKLIPDDPASKTGLTYIEQQRAK